MTRYEKVLAACVVFILAQSAAAKVLGRVEGDLFPVVAPATIVIDHDSSIADTVTQFSGTSEKIRACEFQRVFWRIGRPGDENAPAQLTILETDKVRPEGEFGYGPWIVRMNSGDLLYNSHSFVVHKCHFLWDTISEFYSPPPNPDAAEVTEEPD